MNGEQWKWAKTACRAVGRGRHCALSFRMSQSSECAGEGRRTDRTAVLIHLVQTIALILCMLLVMGMARAESVVKHLGNYADIKIERKIAKISDAEVEETIQYMLSLYAEKHDDGTFVSPKLTDEFVAERLGDDSVEDYRNRLRGILQEEKEAEALRTWKEAFLARLIDDSKVSLDESEIAKKVADYKEIYRTYRDQADVDWETFCEEYYGMSQTAFETALREQAIYQLSAEMLMRAIAENMGISLGEDDYQTRRSAFQMQYNLSDDQMKVRYPEERLRLMFERELVWEELLRNCS
ncbi:MAG: hypothetical protein RR893_13995 [Clostridia bacterium]